MPRCREIAALASDLVDRKVGPGARVAIAWHTLHCTACRTYVRGVRETVALTRGWARQESAADGALMAQFRLWAARSPQPAHATTSVGLAGAQGIALVVALASLVLALSSGAPVGFAGVSALRALVCSGAHLVAAAAPAGAVFFWMARRRSDRLPGGVVAAAGVGALAMQVFDRCPGSEGLHHLLVFHSGAVWLAIAIALVGVRRWLPRAA